MDNVKIASGSIIGSVHRKMNYNNQDHYVLEQGEDFIIGIVADGCGSGCNSEVGAKLGIRFMADYIKQSIYLEQEWKSSLKLETLGYLKKLLKVQKPMDMSGFIHDYLLFTVIGFVIYGDELILFHAGDGVIGLNEEIKIIDQKNKPKYLAYGLFKDELEFNIESMSISQVKQIVIATDGLEDLLQEGFAMNDLVNEAFFSDPVALSVFLQKKMQGDILRDDTTMILLQRS